MKLIAIFAIACIAATAAAPVDPTTVKPAPAPAPQAPAPAPSSVPRSGRYILLDNYSIYDTVREVVIPYNAQYVIQRNAGPNRDVYLGTVQLSPSREVVLTTV